MAKMERTKYPGIYKRGGSYVIVWQHRGKQYKEFHRTLAEAREAKAERSRRGGDRRKRERVRFDDYAEQWIRTYRGRTSRGFRETTRAEYRRDVERNLIPRFGTFYLDEIEAPDVREWFEWMEGRGKSETAIRKAKAALSALFGTALEDGKVRSNPVIGVRYVAAEGVKRPRKRRGLTGAELRRFMAAVDEDWRLFFIVLAHTGIRVGEALGLTWADLHLGDDPTVTISDQVYRGKRGDLKTDNARRTLPLSPGMARALTDWRERTDYPEPGSPVFASSAGTPLDYSRLRREVWLPARDAAGIPGDEVGAFHTFRHTTATALHASGKTGRQLGDWIGHADPTFTVRQYVGASDDGMGEATFLDELIPVDGWARGGQGDAREAPETDPAAESADRLSQAVRVD